MTMTEAEDRQKREWELYEVLARFISAAFWLFIAGWALVGGKGDYVATAILAGGVLFAGLSIFAKGLLAAIPLAPGRIVVFLGSSGFSA